MIAALMSQLMADDSQLRTAGALSALSWMTGFSDLRPIERDEHPADPDAVSAQAHLAEQVATGAVAPVVPVGYADGVLDAMLWALGECPTAPLV